MNDSEAPKPAKPERYSWTVDGMEPDENGAWIRSDATGLELLKSANRQRNAGVCVARQPGMSPGMELEDCARCNSRTLRGGACYASTAGAGVKGLSK